MKTRRKNISADPVTAWARDVVSGKVVAGPHIRNAAKRHILDLDVAHERGLCWDLSAAVRAIGFFEDVLRLAAGAFEGKPFILEPSQKFIVGSIFGWKWKSTMFRRFRRAYIEEGKGNGKALAIDTPIPTPFGWTTMGELRVGDQVFDETGAIRNVVGAFDVMHGHQCYRIGFSDGAEIIADAEHLWVTSALRTGTTKGPKPASALRKGKPGIRTTEQIARTLKIPPSTSRHPQPKWNHRVDIAGALSTVTAELPIPPYVLGCWLGDGNTDDARMTVSYEDWGIVEEIRSEGVTVEERPVIDGRAPRVILGGGNRKQAARDESVQARLRSLGVLSNKHIPSIYLRAARQQRADLLQGLMDTDGYISAAGQCELCLTNKRLATDALELIRSLGIKATIKESAAKLYGREVGTRYRMLFYPQIPVFRLQRKLNRAKAVPQTRPLSRGRMIVSCDPVSSVPVRCISVDSPSRLYLAGHGMVPTHNTPLAAGIGMYCLVADGEPGAEVYAAASMKSQAIYIFRAAVAMWRQSPALNRILTSSGVNPVWNLADLRNGSFFRYISSEEGHSGPLPHCALCDEVHEHRDGHMIEMLERGFKSRRQPILLMITNAGSDRNSVCWEEHLHAVRVAAGNREAERDAKFIGEVIDDSAFSFVCSLDEDDDPLMDPSCWVKANPLLGVTMPVEELERAVRQARNLPGKLNNILRLHFCVWTDAEQAWITRETLETVMHEFDPERHSGEEVHIGADLSATQDLTALAFVVPTGRDSEGRPTFDAWVDCWTPADTLAEREVRDKAPYSIWVEKGFLRTTPGKVIGFEFVAARISEVVGLYDVKALAYDAYGFNRHFEPQLDLLGVSVPTVEHPQGGKKKGKEHGLWMPGSKLILETLILERRIRLLRNPLLIMAMMSAAVEGDPYGNFWFSKRKAINRIDPLIALCMAVGSAVREEKQPPEYQMFFLGKNRTPARFGV